MPGITPGSSPDVLLKRRGYMTERIQIVVLVLPCIPFRSNLALTLLNLAVIKVIISQMKMTIADTGVPEYKKIFLSIP